MINLQRKHRETKQAEKKQEQLELCITGRGGVNWYSYFGELFGISTKAKRCTL